ncbi:hypothetical protein OPW32_17040 [Vibrio europaeus]|uniref:hypothetical protein n=1 Tax=Vibrio europaeus TaxID=300876 RepID=UPI002341D1E2|nr:hypothetical protein [Vibrio europaeus]MDC5850902.1 hypothetical protein [Vibrio europaeus]
MSEQNTLIKDTLMAQVQLNTPELKTNYAYLDEPTKRHVAVATALELIRAHVSASFSHGGTTSNNAYSLKEHMNNLETYTQNILNAMEGNQ